MKRLIKKSKLNNLCIVDVQKEFIEYIPESIFNSIKLFIENNQWDNIVIIVDDNKGNCYIPNWMKNSATQIIHKKYWGVKNDSIYKDILNDKAVQEGNGFRYNNGDLVVDTDNAHDTFKVPKKLEEMSKTISNVILIGGAYGECLEDVEAALKYLGVKTMINNSLTYSAKDKYKDISWSSKIKWEKV